MDKFRYTTLEILRREYGVNNSAKDSFLLSLIESTSNLINNITSNKFSVFKQEIARCIDGSIFHSENLVPIIEFINFKISNDKTCGCPTRPDFLFTVSSGVDEIIPLDHIDIRKSYIKLLLDLDGNYGKLNSYFGCITKAAKIETTTTAIITPNTIKIPLTSVDGLREGRILYINDELNVIINDIDKSTNTVLVDKTYNDIDIASGSTVVSHGYMKEDIVRACSLLILDKLPSSNKNEGSSSTVPTSTLQLKRERTDNYEYEYFAPTTASSGGSSTGGGPVNGLTGNTDVDTILEMYMPPQVGFAI